MAATGGASQGAGTPSDALTALVNTVVDTAQHPPAEPAPDPNAAAAFALGWQMAELYRPDSKTRTVSRNDLPGIGRLDSREHATISLNQIAAALAKLGPAISAAGLTVPEPDQRRGDKRRVRAPPDRQAVLVAGRSGFGPPRARRQERASVTDKRVN